MTEHCVDVTCPPGVAEGDLISVSFSGNSYDVAVPQGILEGDLFQVFLPEAPPAEDAPPPEMDDVLAALNVVLDALEDHDDDVLDNIVDRNCAEFAEWEAGSEAKLEWHALFMTYVHECEGFIGEVLQTINTSPEIVFEQAQTYAGSDQRVQRLITRLLATDDFETFCKMVRALPRGAWTRRGRRRRAACCWPLHACSLTAPHVRFPPDARSVRDPTDI